MKYILIYLLLILIRSGYSQPPYELSANVYRVPYANGTAMSVSRDHFTHTSPDGDVTGRYDLVGTGQGSGCGIYRLVAAAAGIVRRVVDTHNTTCTGDGCGDYNNYVWIEHANGEWSKYTHMKQHSASQDAGLVVGQAVCAGTFLGYECDIGHADGQHLHFEVRRPNDPSNVIISVNGGYMDRVNGAHVIPVFTPGSKHYFEDGDNWAGSSGMNCASTNITVPAINQPDSTIKVYMASNSITTNSNSIWFQNKSDGLFQSGNSITLLPGFTASPGSYFHARIRSCGVTPFPNTTCIY